MPITIHDNTDTRVSERDARDARAWPDESVEVMTLLEREVAAKRSSRSEAQAVGASPVADEKEPGFLASRGADLRRWLAFFRVPESAERWIDGGTSLHLFWPGCPLPVNAQAAQQRCCSDETSL